MMQRVSMGMRLARPQVTYQSLAPFGQEEPPDNVSRNLVLHIPASVI